MQPYALLRLIWRPASLFLLFPLFWAVAWPLALVADPGGDPIVAIVRGESSSVMQRATVLMAVLVGSATALIANLPRLEIQHSASAWTLPGLREGLAAGYASIGLIAALLAMSIASRVGPLALALATGAIALLSFSIAGLVIDSLSPRPLRWMGAMAIGLAAVGYHDLTELVSLAPGESTVTAVIASAVIIAGSLSPGLARARPFRFSAAFGAASHSALVDYWARHGREARWFNNLATEGIAAWLRAAEYEQSGARGMRYLAAQSMQALIVSVMVLWLSETAMLAFLGIALGIPGFLLRGVIHRPIGRETRFRVAYFGALIDLVSLVVLTALLYPFVGVIARQLWPSATVGDDFLLVLALVAALAPIAQWSSVRGRVPDLSKPYSWRSFLRQNGGFVLFVIAVAGTNRLLLQRLQLDTGSAILVITLIAATMHTLQWVMARRYHLSVDLPG